jgi:hypothetical protein
MPQRKKPESFLSAIVAAVSSTAATRVTPEPDEKIHVR